MQDFDDARIRLVREANTSVLAARLNQAVALSRGEFIARMDADDVCFPDRLSRQVARLREDMDLDLIGCGAVVFTSRGSLIGEMPVGLRTPGHCRAALCRLSRFLIQPGAGAPIGSEDNPYDSRLRYAEDQDLLLRSFRHSKFAGSMRFCSAIARISWP